MTELKNKPRVFLSHSKKDEAFIKKIDNDLRGCQIDTWLDIADIRHGQPWLDAIFESGIPTCDCVLVYLTDNSVQSPMVKKEIDASLIQKLKNSNISFLPYVSSEFVREKLRSDLQALQILEWNDDNYEEMLPRIVAEIWRGFLERSISIAVSNEKVQKLETELELEKIKKKLSDGIFSTSEESDFSYIWKALDKTKSAAFVVWGDVENKKSGDLFVNLQSLIPFLGDVFSLRYHQGLLFQIIDRYTIDDLQEVLHEAEFDIGDELLLFGLVQRQEFPRSYHPKDELQSPFDTGTVSFLKFTEKMDRFKYWLGYKKLLLDEIEWFIK